MKEMETKSSFAISRV